MAEAMTPRDALRALGDLPRYEERLTARAFGMTSMVWGLAGPAIFLTYALAEDALVRHGLEALFSVLWLPWVAAGTALTAAIWHSQAVALRRDPQTRRGMLASAAYILGFFAVSGLSLVAIEVVLDAHFGFHLEMTFAMGLFGAAIGLAQRRAHRHAWLLVATGLLLSAFALALAPAAPPRDVAGLAGAGGTMLAWFLPGLLTYLRG